MEVVLCRPVVSSSGKRSPSNKERRVPLKQKFSELFLYVVIAIAIVAMTILWALKGPETSHTWYSFISFTGIFAIVLVKMFWPVRRSWKVWVLLALFLVVHVVFYTLFLQYAQQWPGFWFLLTMPIEVMFVTVLVYKCIRVLPPKVKL
jgi:cell division protein FtsW (lipid II flippase)